MPLPTGGDPTLETAINEVSEGRARSILRKVARKQPAAKAFIEEMLFVPLPSATHNKQKMFETCIHCRKEYGALHNGAKDCVYHSGMMISVRSRRANC